ncbi:hypothetical protein B0H14DRAFT_3502714 [Mycena olivaceomarginata]|nr:hypothetical protein B0H14DRAFT_3502714 [Mycena olivaceomarginata]
MDGYLSSTASGDQTEFFVELEQTWFVHWPEEAACGLPHNDSGIALDPGQKEALGNATTKRKLQLRSWFHSETPLDPAMDFDSKFVWFRKLLKNF